MARYVQIDKRAPIKSGGDKLRRFLSRTFNGELFVGLWVVLKNMFKRGGSHTLRYPMEKFVMPPRYRGVHKLMRLLESGEDLRGELHRDGDQPRQRRSQKSR